ncbi:hypothetical protein GCM10028867_00310 [Nocardioides pacificus]
MATLVTAETAATETTVGGVKRQAVDGNKHFKGLLIFGRGQGSISPSLRVPVHSNLIIDGDEIAAAQGPSTYGYDKVGFSNNVTIRGDFSGEAALGVNNPHDVLGANDFVVTGTAEGAMLGITSTYARISELHSYSPDADYGTANAFSAQMEISNGGHADNAYSTYIHPPLATGGGTIDKGYNLFLRKPAADAPTNYWSLYAEGKAEFAGTALFKGALPGTASTPGGVYVGQGSNTNVGIEFADGTRNFRIANDQLGALSFELPGVELLAKLKADGEWATRGRVVAGSASGGAVTPTNADAATGVYIGRGPAGNTGIVLTSGTVAYRISNENHRIVFSRPGTAVHLEIDQSGNLITQAGAGLYAQGAGFKVGTATDQRLGFFGATPTLRPSGTPASASDAASTQTLVNDLRAKLIALGLIA